MSSDRLTRDEAAAIAGVRPDTWSAYVTRGQAPAPEERIARTPLWSREVVEGWKAARPGRGRRKASQGAPDASTAQHHADTETDAEVADLRGLED